MKLFNLIRKKFLPPTNFRTECSKRIINYSILSIGSKFTANISFDSKRYGGPKKGYQSFCADSKEEHELFDTPEEARECAWNNFDCFYKHDMKQHKEIG